MDYLFNMELYAGSTLLDSQQLSLITRDTSRHDIASWESFQLGIYGSWVNDIAIISPDNIWAVGDFCIPDSASFTNIGNANYNAAHWDGNEWEFFSWDNLLL
jgi:hypothetical protein